MEHSINENIAHIGQKIAKVCAENQRPAHSVQLLAVSKTVTSDRIALAASSGLRDFGENYVQEGISKIQSLRADWPELRWHFIGAIQSNKTADIAHHFDWVHSVDRLKIAQRLSEQRPTAIGDLAVCLQINIDGAPNKAGVSAPEALALARAIAPLPRLQLRGLMCVPDAHDDAAQKSFFLAMQTLLAQLQNDPVIAAHAPLCNTLSMGMSGDFETAIAAGSTMVRIGSAIFGTRVVTKNEGTS